MQWQLEGDRPIYQQLVDQIMMQIVSGQRKAGGQGPCRAGAGGGSRGKSQHHAAGAGRSGAPGPSVHQSDQRTVCDGG